jgi:methionine-rich copper-binding protein CopC
MNIAKNMEAIFVVAAVLLGATAYANAALPAQQAASAAVVAAAPAKMQLVVVRATRLSAAEKAALVN